jgi:hypothetical protein
MKWTGHVASIEAKRNACSVSMGKPEGKGLQGRARHRWEDNIKMGLREIG